MTYSELDKGWQPKAPPLQAWRDQSPGLVREAPRGLGWGLSVEQIRWLQERAHEMRRNPTEPEKRLWRNLSNSQVEGLKFRRQEVIGPYIADFMCPARSLIIEVDGDTHDEAKDRLRNDVLEQFGFLVLRVTNLDVMTNAEGVVEAIRIAAEGRSSRHNPHPNPSPKGEGLSTGEAQKLLAINLEGSVR